MKIVGVTGAAGFVGVSLCRRLLADGYEVVGVDDLSYGDLGNIAPLLRGIAGYIRAGLGEKQDDVDPDAYVIHVMQLVVSATAMAEVTSGLLGEGAAGRARYDRELTRIAKASLFGRRGARPRETAAAAKKPVKRRRKRTRGDS